MISSSATGTHPAPSGGSTSRTSPDLDLQALAAALAGSIQGEVRFSDGDRHLYATDASNFRQVPLGVVLPRTIEDIVLTVRVCREFGAPITNRGGGTSLAGQATNAAVILDTSKYVTDIVDVDPDAATATVRPGLVLDTLRERIAPLGLTWGPDPATHNRCTIGGMLGNNACGMHAFAFGRVQDNVEELQVLLYDGTVMTVGRHDAGDVRGIVADGGRKGDIYRRLRDLADRYAEPIREHYPTIPRRISGYNLTELLPERGFHLARALVGTEGTCVTILKAKLHLNPLPSGSALVVLGYRDICEAGDHVSELRRADGLYALEGMDGDLLDNIRDGGSKVTALEHLSSAGAYLLCEFRGDSDTEARGAAEAFIGQVGVGAGAPVSRLYTAGPEMADIWGAREAALGVTARFRGELHWPGWEDAAVHPDEVGDYLRDLRGVVRDYGYDAAVYGHLGDGCVHCRINFDLTTTEGRATYRSFCEEAADLVSSYGGSYSGEHGDGQQRGELLERMYGPQLVAAMREFKATFDPANRMNPGKVVDAYALDENLRLDAVDEQWRPGATFAYPDDGFDFNHAQLRCVGVGKCRRDDGAGTMCPSYMVTHEEMHSTRGRARLLFEMLQPDSRLDGWRDETVRQALDLCLSCKGCVVDCPVNVDIATYKAEFQHHHYEGRSRPRIHYATGLIDVWSRVASWVPGLTNLALEAPILGPALKAAAGVAMRRPTPRYAATTFREWFDARGGGDGRGQRQVILFPDTFVNHFEPEIGRATVSVLEDAGYQVTLPPAWLCCGRPLYDHGMLDRAATYLERLVAALTGDVSAGIKIVGMEPSCVAVLRDELRQMRPHDADARRVAEATMTLAEFLVDEAGYSFPTLRREAIVHGHCHHKAVVGMAADGRALDALELDWTELDAGCCGLAGAFGFEAGEKYEVSVAAGERRLLPAVRDAPRETLVIADGFSCRTQIRQLQEINGAGVRRRRALHLAQVIEMARRDGPAGPPNRRTTVEDGYAATGGVRGLTRKDVRMLGLIAAAGLATATLTRLLRRP